MNEKEAAGPDFQQAAEGLEQGLETCHKIISDYRSKLLSIEQGAGSTTGARDPADAGTGN